MSQRTPRLLDRVLTLGAVLGGLCLAWAGATLVLGLTPLVVLSGSMAPAIDTGALAVARTVPAAQVQMGDVVSVVADSGVRVTHRVVDTQALDGGVVELVLQGDANAGPDPQTYRVGEVERVWFHVPHLGRVVSAVSGPGGRLLAIGFVLAALGAIMLSRGGSRRVRPAGTPQHRAGASQGRRATVSVLAVTLLASGALVARATPTSAAFTDTASVITSAPPDSFVSGSLTKPAVTCENRGLSVRFRWPVSTSPVQVTYNAVLGNGDPVSVNPDGPTQYADVFPGLLSTLLGSQRFISVTAHAPPPSPWVSLPGRHNFDVLALGLDANCAGNGS